MVLSIDFFVTIIIFGVSGITVTTATVVTAGFLTILCHPFSILSIAISQGRPKDAIFVTVFAIILIDTSGSNFRPSAITITLTLAFVLRAFVTKNGLTATKTYDLGF